MIYAYTRRKHPCLRKVLVNRVGVADETLRTQIRRAKGEGTAKLLCICEDEKRGMRGEGEESKFKLEMLRNFKEQNCIP